MIIMVHLLVKVAWVCDATIYVSQVVSNYIDLVVGQNNEIQILNFCNFL